MTDKNTFSLSSYRRATLNFMGISSWQLRDKKPETGEVEQQAPRTPPTAQQSTTNESSAIPLVVARGSRQRILGEGKCLLHFSDKTLPVKFLEDVLTALGFEHGQWIFADEHPNADFEDFSLQWRITDTLSRDSGVLQTPAVDLLLTAEHKKALWQLIQ